MNILICLGFLVVCALPYSLTEYTDETCQRPNENYHEGNACQDTCVHKLARKQCNKRLRKIEHLRNCYCNEGFARDQTGTCIAARECKNRLNGICKADEEEYRYDIYFNNECAEQLDVEVSFKYVFGCFCKQGLKRNKQGTCVEKCD